MPAELHGLVPTTVPLVFTQHNIRPDAALLANFSCDYYAVLGALAEFQCQPSHLLLAAPADHSIRVLRTYGTISHCTPGCC